jgi:uncharacterized membrane protein YkvA (DUF1232 family)
VSTVPYEVDAIRRQMAEIRRELHEDVREVVATAEAVTDWRAYLSRYPWVALGAAFAVGYLVVPRRHRPVATRADLSEVREAVESARQTVVEAAMGKDEGAARRRKGLIGAALGMLTPLALRAAQGYALKYLEHWIAAQQMAAAHAGPPPYPGPQGPPRPGPGRAPGPRREAGPGMA